MESSAVLTGSRPRNVSPQVANTEGFFSEACDRLSGMNERAAHVERRLYALCDRLGIAIKPDGIAEGPVAPDGMLASTSRSMDALSGRISEIDDLVARLDNRL